MFAFTNLWDSATDKGRWAARGASFVAKVKATKAVWFPPAPEDAVKKTASTAKKTTRKTAKKATKPATKKASAAKKKATSGATS